MAAIGQRLLHILNRGDTTIDPAPGANLTPGDGYQPPYDYGRYELNAYGEPLQPPAATPGAYGLPWLGPRNFPPGMGAEKIGMMCQIASADAVRRPGITGTQPSTVASTTDWRPQFTIQQVAYNNALKQRTSIN